MRGLSIHSGPKEPGFAASNSIVTLRGLAAGGGSGSGSFNSPGAASRNQPHAAADAMPGFECTFRPVTREDLLLLFRGLPAPEAALWRGCPRKEAALLENDLEEPRMVMRIVSLGERPFAYLQDYDVHGWPPPHFAHLPQRSRAIDTFIGEPSRTGRGHGSIYLRWRALQLRAGGAPVVAMAAPPVIRSSHKLSMAGAGHERRCKSSPGEPLLARRLSASQGGGQHAAGAPLKPGCQGCAGGLNVSSGNCD